MNNLLFSIQVDAFQEEFNNATRQAVKLQMSAIGLQAKASSLEPWQFKGFAQRDEQKDLMRQVKELASTVEQINNTIY